MAAEAWDGELTAALRQEFGESLEKSASYLGQRFLVVAPQAVVSLIRHLKAQESFDMLIDLTAVDYPKRDRRFELIYEIYSFSRNERLRVKANLADGEAGAVVDGRPSRCQLAGTRSVRYVRNSVRGSSRIEANPVAR
jgi:NADH:ubiquinone oxidoreductase subunit C